MLSYASVRSRGGSVGLVLALATVAAAGRAHAQSAELVRRFPVEFQGGAPGLSVRVTGLGFDIQCGERCAAELMPGQYAVRVTSPDGRVSSRNVFIDTPSRLTVTPHNQTARVTGFVLGGVGAGGIGAGVVLLFWAGFKWFFLRLDTECPPPGQCSDDLPGWLVPTGLIALGAGAAIGTTGLLLWRSNAHARVDTEPLAIPSARGGWLRLRPVAGPRWSGLALTAAF
jgi:hypothetical protein